MITEDGIKSVINRHDPEGLLAMGAPEDEYEAEVTCLHIWIRKWPEYHGEDFTQENLAESIHQVFSMMFDRLFSIKDTEKYLPMAKEIMELEE